LHEGAGRLGWKSLEVPRWFRYEGQSSRGLRQSMTKTFVPRFLRAGGKLLPGIRIERIRAENGEWNLFGVYPLGCPGAEKPNTLKGGHQAGGHRGVRIRGETLFVGGGGVKTPGWLLGGGITKNIGNSLRLPPTVKITAKFAEPVNSAEMGV